MAYYIQALIQSATSVQDGMTPLIFASGGGHVAVAELLLQANSDVSICAEVCKLVKYCEIECHCPSCGDYNIQCSL